MARVPNEKVNEAHELYKKGLKLVEIAKQLNIPDGTIRRWKKTYSWNSERSDKNSERSERKKGGQPGNKNATGPPGNKNSETHGFFSKYLPVDTLEVLLEIEKKNPLDILWENIYIQYAAIIRSQSIMHVESKDEMIKELKRSKVKTKGRSTEKASTNESEEEYEYEFQFAWDRQATFLQAQSRAMKTLEGMIKQYDELLKSELATEEQKLRIQKLKKDIAKDDNKDKPIEIIIKRKGED